MTFAEFEKTLSDKVPPTGASPSVAALWHLARGDWDRAHRIVQDDSSATAAWVHAHLHRVEGDAWNAGYWYGRAGRPHSRLGLEEERRELVAALWPAG